MKEAVQWETGGNVAPCECKGTVPTSAQQALLCELTPLQACWHATVVGKRSIAAVLDGEPHLRPPQVAKGTARSGSGWEPSSAKTGLNSRMQRPLQSAVRRPQQSMLLSC